MDRLRLLFARFRTNILNPFKSYLSTPIAKITIANSILFVPRYLPRHSGRLMMFLQLSWPSTLPSRERTYSRIESILSLLTVSRICPFCILVAIFLLSYQYNRPQYDRYENKSELWFKIRVGALYDGSFGWRHNYAILDAL